MKKLAALPLAICLLAVTPAVLPAADDTGLTLDNATSDGTMAVQTVRAGTPAALSGLHPGDVVMEVDGLSVRDRQPQELLDRIDGKLASGRSAVLVFRRGDWKSAAWICPLRLSHAQQGTLRFAGNFRALHDNADKTWSDLCRAFNMTMKGPAERKAFLDNADSWRNALRRYGRAGTSLEIPGAVSGSRRKTLQDLTIGFSREQSLRIKTLALMEDYLENMADSRMPAAFSQLDSPYENLGARQTVGERRWNRMVETAKKARRSETRLQALFGDAARNSDLADKGLLDPVL